jgi:uncharacterized protein (DUF2236 family)
VDDGFFGPASITWKIHAHPCMLVGGLRALLLQALNPRAMAAVDQHSTYKDDPWGRLTATSRYITDTTFGDTARAEAAAARVRQIHRHVRGFDDFSGLPYDAEDPELLLWIHCAEIDSFLAGYRAFGGRLEDEEADLYVAEMVTAAELVGVNRDDVPDSVVALNRYLDDQDLVASPAARAAMRFILFPPVVWPGGSYPRIPGGRLLAIPARAGWTLPSAGAVALLPDRARRAYRLPNLRPTLPALRLAMPAFIKALQIVAPPPPGLAELQARIHAA